MGQNSKTTTTKKLGNQNSVTSRFSKKKNVALLAYGADADASADADADAEANV